MFVKLLLAIFTLPFIDTVTCARDGRKHTISPSKKESKRPRKTINQVYNDEQRQAADPFFNQLLYDNQRGTYEFQPGGASSSSNAVQMFDPLQSELRNEEYNILMNTFEPLNYAETFNSLCIAGHSNSGGEYTFGRNSLLSQVNEPFASSSSFIRNPNSYPTNIATKLGNSNQYYRPCLKLESVQNDENELDEQSEENLNEFVDSLFNFPEDQELNVPSATIPLLASGKHKFVKVDGLSKNTRKRCSECMQRNKETHFQYLKRNQIKKVNTICNKCERYFCANCFKEVHQLESIPTIATTQQPKTDQVCSYCNITLGQDEDTLIQHTWECQKIPRKGEKWFGCYQCGHNFKNRYAIALHIRVHTGHKPFKCNICPYAAADNNSLTLHLRGHSGDRPYLCHLCDTYAARDKSTLNLHLRKRHKVDILYGKQKLPRTR